MSDCRFGVSPVNYPYPDDENNENLTAVCVDMKACGCVCGLRAHGFPVLSVYIYTL